MTSGSLSGTARAASKTSPCNHQGIGAAHERIGPKSAAADIAEKTLKAAWEVVQHLCREAQNLANMVCQWRFAARLEKVLNLGEQVIKHARRVNAGQRKLPQRLVSIFDPEARFIKRGKAHRETEVGHKVRLTENAERLITEYSVMMGNPPDKELLVPGNIEHVRRTGWVPQGVATDREFWVPANERALKKMGVKKVSLPFKGKRSRRHTEHERQSWFRRLQRWRAGQEETISELKRRYGLHYILRRVAMGGEKKTHHILQ